MRLLLLFLYITINFPPAIAQNLMNKKCNNILYRLGHTQTYPGIYQTSFTDGNENGLCGPTCLINLVPLYSPSGHEIDYNAEIYRIFDLLDYNFQIPAEYLIHPFGALDIDYLGLTIPKFFKQPTSVYRRDSLLVHQYTDGHTKLGMKVKPSLGINHLKNGVLENGSVILLLTGYDRELSSNRSLPKIIGGHFVLLNRITRKQRGVFIGDIFDPIRGYQGIVITEVKISASKEPILKVQFFENELAPLDIYIQHALFIYN